MTSIFAYIPHRDGVADDSAAELAAVARKLNPAVAPIAIVVGTGVELDGACESARARYSDVWKIANHAFFYPNAELIRKALTKILPAGSILLVPHDQFGIDLCPGLSIKVNAAYVSDVVSIEKIEGSSLTVVRQEFGGQVSAHVRCDISTGAVITVRGGAFKALDTPPLSGTVVDKSAETGTLTAGRRYLRTVTAEAGDVDITRQAILVSIGRGIQEKDNVSIAHELAQSLGATVSCSRPVVDAKWLEPSRQVGSSGKTVKPKVYLACGISGSAQHLAGLRGNPFIVAINKNPKAPIFQVADVGIIDDILEFLPELTSKVQEMHSVSAMR